MQAEIVKWSELLRTIVEETLERYGPFAALLVALFILHVVLMHKLYGARLADKDREIKRIADERTQLQNLILKNRLTSTDPGGTDDHSS